MIPILLVHYSEIGTKGRNRPYFEGRLRRDLAARLEGQVESVRVDNGRIIAPLKPGYSLEAIHVAFRRTFGVAWYALGFWTQRDLDGVTPAALALADRNPTARTFKVFCRRADKAYPLSSQEVCNRLGDSLRLGRGLTVDLDDPHLGVTVEILPNGACVVDAKTPGLRGMPRGSSGRLLCLFSGGIDSPVAAWSLMRRGGRVDLVHFHPFSRAEEVMGSKITALHDVLRRFNPHCRLILISHDRYQVAAALSVPAECETVVFRRFMLFCAQELARRRGWKALITGDCLGQVASQTLDNMAAAQSGLEIPVFQPLIAQDKDDIVKTAKAIGAFALSNQPYKDCCSLLSRKPKTNVSVEQAREAAGRLDMPALVAGSLATARVWDGETLSPMAPRAAVPVI
jgi:thiamine biosynthesis protein ThiI